MSTLSAFVLFVILIALLASAVTIALRRRAVRRTPADPRGDDVRFTVFRPSAIAPEKWYDFLVFAHRSDLNTAPADVRSPAARMQQEAERLLGSAMRSYSKVTEDSSAPVVRNTAVTFVPRVEGVEFNPPSVTIDWVEDVHRAQFQMRADDSLDGQTARGALAVYAGPLLLAELALVIPVSVNAEQLAENAAAHESVTPYRKVFASYSHRDTEIVAQMETYARALGDQYLRDVTTLRSGEQWNDRLLELIEEADVFQLFWSWNALRSEYVRQEWMHALSLNRPFFVRPVYWEDPLPAAPERGLPPAELRALHFQRLPFGTSHAAVQPAAPRPDTPVARGGTRGTVPPPPESIPRRAKLARSRRPPSIAEKSEPPPASAPEPVPAASPAASRSGHSAPPSRQSAPPRRWAGWRWLPSLAAVMLLVSVFTVGRLRIDRTPFPDPFEPGALPAGQPPGEAPTTDPDPASPPNGQMAGNAFVLSFESAPDPAAGRLARTLFDSLFAGAPRAPLGQPLSASRADASLAGAREVVLVRAAEDGGVVLFIIDPLSGDTVRTDSLRRRSGETAARFSSRIESAIRIAQDRDPGIR